MRGIPKVFNTKADWLNTHDYINKKEDAGQKTMFKSRLEALKESSTASVLKAGTTKPAEELDANDFEKVNDPASSLARSGLEIEEINFIIKKIK